MPRHVDDELITYLSEQSKRELNKLADDLSFIKDTIGNLEKIVVNELNYREFGTAEHTRMVVGNKIIASILVALDTHNFMTGMTYEELSVDNRLGNLENNTFADIMIPGVKLLLVDGCVWSITRCERAPKGCCFVVLVSGVHLDNYKHIDSTLSHV
jgi:hypothetical protein